MQLNYSEYQNQFSGDRREKALERAWKNRDFEIELYWKRATYFWTFLVSTFAGYFIIISQPAVAKAFPQAELVVICLGFVFSLSWYFVNKGSKKWQENWERHIDMLEESITGNIYKTVYDKSGYSVSGVNTVISLFVGTVWFLLGINFFTKPDYIISFSLSVDFITITILLVSLFFIILLFRERRTSEIGPSKDTEGRVEISFSLRNFGYKNIS